MADLSTLLISWLQILIPQPCFDEFFVKYHFLDVDCLKIVVSKCLGFSIILGSVLVKVPQIVKIQSAKSAEGISITGVTLEISAVISSLAYGYASGFPFSSYGEACFLLLQTWMIAFLVLYYNGQLTTAVIYSSILVALLAFLMSGAAPMQLLWLLQAGVMPNIALGRMIQAATNYRNASTGQLSAITVFMLFSGALARVFTSIQETGDTVIVATYLVTSLCNAIIAFQMVYYWNSGQTTKAKQQ